MYIIYIIHSSIEVLLYISRFPIDLYLLLELAQITHGLLVRHKNPGVDAEDPKSHLDHSWLTRRTGPSGSWVKTDAAGFWVKTLSTWKQKP